MQPRPGRQWAAIGGDAREPGREPRPRLRATFNRTGGVRHLFAAYDLGRDKLYGHIKPHKTRTRFLEFCPYLRTLYTREIRIALVIDNFSPHLSTKRDRRVGVWAEANNVELAYIATTAPGSTGSRLSSPRCATSRSTAPTTEPTGSKAA